MTDRLLYQVTLASGVVVTTPEAFGADDFQPEINSQIVVAEDGGCCRLRVTAS